ncbi:MAG: PTS sugar transporter [Chloroflexi bacterium]|nr:PTS sugar transporter [Chloroflexota bacterium]
MKKIAVVGSSGGHLYVLGGNNPQVLLEEIASQAKAANLEISHVVFVAANSSLDHVTEQTKAILWKQSSSGPVPANEGKLAEVNKQAESENKALAASIRNGEVDGLILVSADPKGINSEVVKAAADKKIPVAGTGGSSMSNARSLGANVISSSGTTGSTNRTRAVGYISAFASEWKTKYSPVIGKAAEVDTGNIFKRINLRSIMMASLPAFIAMALVLAIGKIPFLNESVGPIFDVLIAALPVVVAVVAAKQVSGLDEVGIVAGVVAGTLSVSGGILGGIVGGILAGILASYLLQWSFRMRFPATTSSLIAGALGGMIGGLTIYFGLAPITLWLGNGMRELIQIALDYNAILAGAVAGLLIWPAIIGGVYHAAILPIILLEMELQGNSFLGAVDMVGLVMVSAGITLANIIGPRQKSEASVAAPGFFVNMAFGTFVEAAYPFMFADKLVFAIALISATIGGAFTGFFNARGSGYLPTFVAPTVSNNPFGFAASMAIAAIVACVLTLIANQIAKRKMAS